LKPGRPSCATFRDIDSDREVTAEGLRRVGQNETLYKRGLTTFLNVLDSQRDLYAAEDLLVQSDQLVVENLIFRTIERNTVQKWGTQS
jgi:outer membrane protein TolC